MVRDIDLSEKRRENAASAAAFLLRKSKFTSRQ